MPEVTPAERTTQAAVVAPLTARSRSEAMLVRQARAPSKSMHTSHSTWASFISDITSTEMKAAARTIPVTTRAIDLTIPLLDSRDSIRCSQRMRRRNRSEIEAARRSE
jgi:hypothetical protein